MANKTVEVKIPEELYALVKTAGEKGIRRGRGEPVKMTVAELCAMYVRTGYFRRKSANKWSRAHPKPGKKAATVKSTPKTAKKPATVKAKKPATVKAKKAAGKRANAAHTGPKKSAAPKPEAPKTDTGGGLLD